MGKIIHFQCPQCNFQKEIYVGAGLRDCDLSIIASALPENGQLRLADSIQSGAVGVSIDRAISVCNACKALITLPVVSYFINGEKRELRGICPNCGEPGVNATVSPPAVPCPHCGTALQAQPAGHWD